MTRADDTGPLAGVRVLEMGQLLAGPYCGQLLGDYGADVVKLEDPEKGDPMRQWGREHADGSPMWWPIIARNKRSVTCDLRTADGQRIARRLAATSDIVIENFRPGTLERWGLTYDEMAAGNPGLILVRVSGFGQSGPYAGRAGYASIGEAMGGLRYVVGDPDRPPSRCGISIGDSLAATFACMGALTALHRRTVSGKGQVVDSAIYESVLAVMESLIPEWVLAGHQRERTGATLPNVAPSNVYPTADADEVLIAANMDSVFGRLATAMGRPELADDDRFATHAARGANSETLDALISEWTSTLTAQKVLEHLEEHGVPAGRIYKPRDMVDDPQFLARDAIIDVPHEQFGRFPMQNVFPKLSATPGTVRWPGPKLGEHTDQVLTERLGYSAAQIRQLRADAVI